MTLRAPRPATYDDLVASPEHVVGELIAGQLHVSPSVRARIAHLWWLDPLSETLEIHRLEGEYWVLLAAHGGDDTVKAEPFEMAELELQRLWPWLSGGR